MDIVAIFLLVYSTARLGILWAGSSRFLYLVFSGMLWVIALYVFDKTGWWPANYQEQPILGSWSHFYFESFLLGFISALFAGILERYTAPR
jgi:hypothetical protein